MKSWNTGSLVSRIAEPSSANPTTKADLSSRRTVRYLTILALSLIILGFALRLAGYLKNRSLWSDEIAIATNIRVRDFRSLLRPLDYEQTMPVPLLWGLKAAVKTFGTSEYAFRLVLLVAGCGLLPVIWFAFRRLFDSRIALISLGMAAVCRPLIYYSSEVKQYGLDALITVFCLWLGFRVLQQKDDRKWWLLAGWGTVALFLSQPAVFVLAAIGLAALTDDRFKSSPQWRWRCFAIATVWAATFAFLYFYSYRVVSQSAYMREFWSSRFLHPMSHDIVHELAAAIYVLLGTEHLDYMRTVVLAPLFAVGLYGIWRQFGRTGLIIAAFPFLEVLLASATQHYPIANRLVLFLFPILFWIYATALVTLSDWFRPTLRSGVLVALAVSFLAPTVIKTIRYVDHFPLREANRQLVALINRTDSSAATYIAFDDYLPWAYYESHWKHPDALKARLKLAFHNPDGCEFRYASGKSTREEIVGTLPPITAGAANASADEYWAQTEASKIASLREPDVWVFVPIYPDNPAVGRNFKERMLLEKLQADLAQDHVTLLRRYAIGDSLAFLYATPERQEQGAKL